VLIAGQAVRATGYGFTAVLLGALLADRRYSHLRAAVVLTALIAGTALSCLLVGALADRVGRRRSHAVLFLGVAAAGAVVGVGAPFWVLLVVALTGTLSSDVVDNGPATTLEQAMLAGEDAGTARAYGVYNAVGATAGALGALAAALPGLGAGTVSNWWFAVLVPVGLAGLRWRHGCHRRWRPAPARSRWPTRRPPAPGLGPPAAWCAGWRRCSPSTPAAAGWSPPASSPTTSPLGTARR
jgi:MFS family permease